MMRTLCLIVALALAPVIHAAENPLVLGIFPRFNFNETSKRYAPLAGYLRAQLQRDIRLATSKDFASFWRGVEQQRYDIVLYNQYHYIRSAGTYRVIAHNKEFGKSTMAGVLYVRKDSGITELAQLRGRTVLFGGGEDAMISYIAPVYLMLQAGLRKNDFKSKFAVAPINSVIGVYHRQADAAGTADIVVAQPAVRSAIDTAELAPLARSEQLLHLPWAVKQSMPPPLRDAIQSALVGLESSDAGRQVLRAAVLTGIGKAEDSDYDPHRRMVRVVRGAALSGPSR
jgi:phosphonate transport system substrate-binding protein